jgi:hypothetical protein
MTFMVSSSQATFKGWMDIMYAAVDSRGVGCHQLCGRSQAGRSPRWEGWGHSGVGVCVGGVVAVVRPSSACMCACVCACVCMCVSMCV